MVSARTVAPGASRHPWAWDLLGRGQLSRSTDPLLERTVRPFAHLDLHADGLASGFEFMRDWTARDALYVTRRRARLLAGRGWIVAPPLVLEERGVIDHKDFRGNRPGVRHYLASLARGRQRTVAGPIISLRGGGETNYFHVLNDLVGGRLRLSDEAGVSADVPIVVSEAMAGTAVFQGLRALTALGDRPCIVQGAREILAAESVYFAETPMHSHESFDYLRALLQLPDSDRAAEGRVFLTRSSRAGRAIANEDDVREVCRRFGFEPVDTAGKTLAEQIEIFSGARHVVGVHGAGLTNLIFRTNAPLDLLEIFPSHLATWPPAHFFLLCRSYGFGYRAMTAGAEGPTVHQSDALAHPGYEPLSVDPDVLAVRLRAMLDGA